MPLLPYQQSDSADLTLLQGRWIPLLNPLLKSPLAQGQLLPNITVASGTNVINHLLGRKLLGYIPVLNSAAVTFSDTQSTNQTPDKTLQLVASGASTVSLWVF